MEGRRGRGSVFPDRIPMKNKKKRIFRRCKFSLNFISYDAKSAPHIRKISAPLQKNGANKAP